MSIRHVQFVSPDGDDTRDGQSWATAKRTILAAYDAIMPSSLDYPAEVGGTIFIASGAEVGGVPGQGIWISPKAGAAPNPALWRLPKPVRFVGVGAAAGAFPSGPPQAVIRSSTTDGSWLGPVIWFAGDKQAPMMVFENLFLEAAPAPGRAVVDLNAHWIDGTWSGEGGALAFVRFDNCFISTLGSTAPTVDVGWCFWTWFDHCTIQGSGQADAWGTDAGACVRFARNDLGPYAGNIYFESTVFNIGHVVLSFANVGPLTFRHAICENFKGSVARFEGDGVTTEFALTFAIPVSPRAPNGWWVGMRKWPPRISDPDPHEMDPESYRVVPNPDQWTAPGGTLIFRRPPPSRAEVLVKPPWSFFVARCPPATPDGTQALRSAPYLILEDFQPSTDAKTDRMVTTLDHRVTPRIFSEGNLYAPGSGLDLTEHALDVMQAGVNGATDVAVVRGGGYDGSRSGRLPSRSGVVGAGPGPILWGRHDGAARALPAIAVRFENLLVPGRATGNQSQFSYPEGYAAPDGSDRALAPNTTFTLYANSQLSLSVGDAFIVAAWASIVDGQVANGIYVNPTVIENMTMNATRGVSPAVELAQLHGVWQLTKLLFVVQSVENPPQAFAVALHGLQYQYPISLFRPTVVLVPAAAATKDELCEFFQHFLPLPLGAPGGGDIVLDRGQRLTFWDDQSQTWRHLDVDGGVLRVT